MKKLLSVFAAAAMLFGFASCSGDLHDAQIIDLTGYGIRGTMNNYDANSQIPLVANEDGTYSAEYSVTAYQTEGDKEIEGETRFAIAADGDGSWATAYRLAQPKSEGDKANVFGANKWEQKVYLGQSAECMMVPAMKGDKVSILVTPSTTYLTVKVTVKAGAAPVVPADPVPFYLDGFYISGDMNKWAGSMDTLLWSPTLDKDTGILTYKYDFAATQEAYEFGIRNNTGDWKVKYVDGEFAFGTDSDFVAVVKHDDGKGTNNKITGLTKDSNYRIYVQTTPEKEVSFKVVVLNKATINVNVTGLPDEANGKVMYLTGDYFGWNEPGDGNSSIKGTVADGAVSYSFDYIYEGTTFELQVQGKAGSKGWTKPEISGPDGENASFTVTHEKTTVTVTYVETKEITSTDTSTEKDWGLQYRCKWDVK